MPLERVNARKAIARMPGGTIFYSTTHYDGAEPGWGWITIGPMVPEDDYRLVKEYDFQAHRQDSGRYSEWSRIFSTEYKYTIRRWGRAGELLPFEPSSLY